MFYKKYNSHTVWVAVSLIALILLTTSGFNHSYTAFAVSKKDGRSSSTSSKSSSGGGFSIGGTSSSSATTANPNALTKKELSSFISCINTANKSTEGLTHKVATNCLDTAKGITPTPTPTTTTTPASSSTTTGRSGSSSGSSPSLAPSAGSST